MRAVVNEGVGGRTSSVHLVRPEHARYLRKVYQFHCFEVHGQLQDARFGEMSMVWQRSPYIIRRCPVDVKADVERGIMAVQAVYVWSL